jgi:hypothetical protein
MKLTCEKVLLSWTDSKTITIAISLTFTNSERECLRKLLESILHHIRVTGLMSYGFLSMVVVFSFIVILKSDDCMPRFTGDKMGSNEPSGNFAVLKGMEWP